MPKLVAWELHGFIFCLCHFGKSCGQPGSFLIYQVRIIDLCIFVMVSSIYNTQKVLSEKELTELFSVTDIVVYILSIGRTDLEKQVRQKYKQRCVTDLREWQAQALIEMA